MTEIKESLALLNVGIKIGLELAAQTIEISKDQENFHLSAGDISQLLERVLLEEVDDRHEFII